MWARGVYAGCPAAHISPLPLRQGQRKVFKKHDVSRKRPGDRIRGGEGGGGGGPALILYDPRLLAHSKGSLLTQRTRSWAAAMGSQAELQRQRQRQRGGDRDCDRVRVHARHCLQLFHTRRLSFGTASLYFIQSEVHTCG